LVVKGVIFDLDGTLLDSLGGIADSMNSLLNRKDYPTHHLDAYRYFVGDGIDELVRRALPDTELPGIDLNQLVLQYRQIYDYTWREKTRLYDGIKEMLDLLITKDIKLAVLSNKSDDFTKLMVKQLLWKWPFERVQGLRLDTPPKPDPEMALSIAKKMGLATEEMVFMGDSGVDMLTAKRAKMNAVGVLWGFRDAEELLSNGASVLLKHPCELKEAILL
jgi:phosphoglycolate phosphatase